MKLKRVKAKKSYTVRRGRYGGIKGGEAILLAFLMVLMTVLSGCSSSGNSAGGASGSTGNEAAAAAGSGEEAASGAEGGSAGASGSSGKVLTLMLYLCGSDLESKTGAATKDLDEIVASGVNTDLVNVVVMAGGTTQWQNGFSSEETAVYALTAGGGSPDGGTGQAVGSDGEAGTDAGGQASETKETDGAAGTDVGVQEAETDGAAGADVGVQEAETDGAAGAAGASAAGGGNGAGLVWEKKETFASQEAENAPANMGETSTLKSFLDYSYEEFPADNYALIMWNHGGGPMRGLCWDTAWAKDGLTMEEFTGALKDSPFAQEKLSWIGFDACLMSSVETAHLVAPYAEYMIASEETEPCIGWSYDYLAGIEKDQSGKETGIRIVDSFMAAGEAANEASDKESSLTLSCMDLSQIENVEEKMESFFTELDESLSPESFSELSNMREDTREFGKAMNDSQRYDLVDLGDLVSHYEEQAPEQAAALTEALDQMVVYTQSNLDNCHGLSSYHPYYNKTYYEKMWRDEYDSFAFVPGYTDYITKFADIWLGDAMGDWTQMNQVQSAGVEGETQYFSVQLTPEQLQYYASSNLLILTQVGSEDDADSGTAYAQVYASDQVSVDENGVLTAPYNGKTLYAVDGNGEIIAGPLGYSISDDGNLQILGNYINNESGGEHQVMHAMFECADAPAGTNLPVLERHFYDEDNNMWSNRIDINESDYQELLLIYDFKELGRDGDQVMPFSEWEDSSWIGGYEVSLPEEVHFRFFDRIEGGATLFACYEISDTQANLYGTELMEVNNPNVTPISFEDGEKYTVENDYLRVTVSGNVNNTEGDGSLNLHFLMENIWDKPLSGLAPADVKMTDSSRTCTCMPSRGGLSFYNLAPGESDVFDISFNKNTLAGLSALKELSFAFDLKEETPADTSADGTDGSTDTASSEDGGVSTDKADGSADTGTAGEEAGSDDGAAGEDAAADAGTASSEAAAGTSAEDLRFEMAMHPVDLDVSAISGAKEYAENPEGLAEAAQEDLLWTLRSASVKRSGNFDFAVVCKNNGKEPALVKFPKLIAVNDVILKTFSGYGHEQIMIDPGEEYSAVLDAYNYQYENGYFDHLTGSHHLAVSDVLGAEGETEIKSVSLYQVGNRSFEYDPETDLQKHPVRFELSVPVSLDRNTADKSMDDAEQEEEEQTEEEFTQEEMTRALDADGTAPVRTELYSKNGITVYGEHILIADTSVLLSLILENETDQDTVFEFDTWKLNDGEKSGFFSSDYLAFASTKTRVYLQNDFSGSVTDDAVQKISLKIRQENPAAAGDAEQGAAGDRQAEAGQETAAEDQAGAGQETAAEGQTGAGQKASAEDQSAAEGQETAESEDLPIIYELVLNFAEGTAFNLDGGLSMPFEDAQPVVNSPYDFAQAGEPAEFFDAQVKYPENPEQYKKDFTFTLPDSLTEEERASVTDVIIEVDRDCTKNITDEGGQSYREEWNVPEDSSLASLEMLALKLMQKSEEEDTFTCSLSGLMCTLQENPDVYFALLEGVDENGETAYRKLGNGGQCSWYLMPDQDIYDGIFGLEYSFIIAIQNGTVALSGFEIDDEEEEDDFSRYSISMFESLEFNYGAPLYICNSDGSMEYQTMGLDARNYSIPLEGSPKSLQMIPYTDFTSDLRVLYTVMFEDGSSRIFDGGAY